MGLGGRGDTLGIMQGAQTSEDNLGSQSQPGPCGYIYFYPLATYPLREVATLRPATRATGA